MTWRPARSLTLRGITFQAAGRLSTSAARPEILAGRLATMIEARKARLIGIDSSSEMRAAYNAPG